jgi:hypothetical protein
MSKEIEDMSVEELKVYERELDEQDAEDGDPSGSDTEAAESEESGEINSNSEPEKKIPVDSEDIPDDPTGAEREVETETAEVAEEHVSPPEKWIAKRHKDRQSKADEERQDESSVQQARIDALEARLDLVKAQGVEVPDTPMDILSEDNLKSVREEHGDTVADMFLAVKASMPKPQPAQKASVQQPTNEDVRVQAIMQDDHLLYWSQEKPELWQRAINVEAELVTTSGFLNKSPQEQAQAIVGKVKQSVIDERKPKTVIKPKQAGGDPPPQTLAGTSGIAPTPTDNKSPADRMIELAESGSDGEAMKLYDTLPDGAEKLKFENWMEEKEG